MSSKAVISRFIPLLRVPQYLKNFFIFAPVFFAGRILEPNALLNTLIAFLCFSMAASAIYIFNDYKDIEEDRNHPTKKNRPLASGDVDTQLALRISLTLLIFSFLGAYIALPINAVLVLLLYCVLNLGYCLGLKHIALIDVSIIATGFVLRLFFGALATATYLSSWIVIITFLLALFLALAKRRDDILIFLETGKKMRTVVDGYSLTFLDSAISMFAAVIIVAYVSFTTSLDVIERFGTNYLYLTVFFVILGLLRYLQITMIDKDSGSPTKILIRDRFIQITIALWLISYGLIIY